MQQLTVHVSLVEHHDGVHGQQGSLTRAGSLGAAVAAEERSRTVHVGSCGNDCAGRNIGHWQGAVREFATDVTNLEGDAPLVIVAGLEALESFRNPTQNTGLAGFIIERILQIAENLVGTGCLAVDQRAASHGHAEATGNARRGANRCERIREEVDINHGGLTGAGRCVNTFRPYAVLANVVEHFFLPAEGVVPSVERGKELTELFTGNGGRRGSGASHAFPPSCGGHILRWARRTEPAGRRPCGGIGR